MKKSITLSYQKGASFNCLIFKVISIIFLIVFIPILFCIFAWGNKMDYNLINKLVTLCDNKILVLIGIPGLLIFCAFIHLMRNIKMTRKLSIITSVSLAIIFILMFFVNLEICKCINIAHGWDVSVVVGGAYNLYNGGVLGNDSYYWLCPNNVPITYVLYKLYELATHIKDYPYKLEFIWVISICIMVSVAGYLTCISIKKITNNLVITVITCILYIACVCFTPWKTVPYTDMFSMIFPVICICLYVLQYYCKINWIKYGLWFGIFAMGFIGSLIKPTVFIIPIAIFLCEMVGCIASFRDKWKGFITKTVLVVISIFIYVTCQNYVYDNSGYQKHDEIELTALHYMMMGLNENSTGSYNSEDLAISGGIMIRDERTDKQIEVIKQRLEEKGFDGYLYFLLRKMVMTFNDGTFGWGREGNFTYDAYPIYTDAEYVSFIRDIFLPNYLYSGRFNTYSQGVWLFIIFCIPGICFIEKDKREICMPILVSLMGTTFYLMLFEARARYLLFVLPILIMAAALGIGQYYNGFQYLVSKIFKKENTNKKIS